MSRHYSILGFKSILDFNSYVRILVGLVKPSHEEADELNYFFLPGIQKLKNKTQSKKIKSEKNIKYK